MDRAWTTEPQQQLTWVRNIIWVLFDKETAGNCILQILYIDVPLSHSSNRMPGELQ